MMTDAEYTVFLRGFDLAQPPGRQELDALDRAEDFAPAGPGQLRVAIRKDLARAILTEVEPLPENLAGAIWLGFIRGTIAKAGGEVIHVHDGVMATTIRSRVGGRGRTSLLANS